MNKLTAMYTMFKKVQEKESMNALITAEAKLDETILATMTTEIHKSADRREKKTEIKFGQETVKFEHSGAADADGKCCGPHGFMHKHHGHGHGHGKGCCGAHSKLDKAMFMLKMLDKTDYVENSDGTSTLSLNVTFDDLPQKVQEHMKQHCCKMHEHGGADCCEKFKGAHAWLETCGCMEIDHATIKPEMVKLVVSLKSDKSPEKVELSLLVHANDQSGKARTMTLQATGQCK